MNPDPKADEWEQALARAGLIAAADQPPALCTEAHWDYVGIRGVLAVVLQALAQQTGRTPEDVPLEVLQRHCERGPGHVRDLAVVLVGDSLAYSLDTDPAAPVPAAGDPARATWLWLTRLWPPEPPDDVDGLPPSRPRPRWDGMPRGIARGNPGAAVDLLPLSAADAATAAMNAM
ncbi:hypothetical protein [Streptomyces caeruleatus]|uniref:Uncharacterized protein n=1 Tax=Streptomyces caeruleatus TaxID=661399 RepID=A0A101U5H4_9ACTN|nr:hypothetical protein [Streptomyces caeruleatus]KUO04571.1 hypothetical protein AQJ67_10165 [Streptomyces caeruleatus]